MSHTPLPRPSANIIDVGDVLVIGAGLAGLFTALKLAPRPVTVMAAGKRKTGSASQWAQGGIAAAIGPDDHVDNHKQDTIMAGAGLVKESVAQLVAEEARARIDDLSQMGVPFDRDADGHLALGREAAHSHNRIIGVRGDQAGREIMKTLIERADASPSIDFMEGYAAYELAVEEGRVVGVFARPSQHSPLSGPLLIRARATILATGGIGYLYGVTTNPMGANGEALAMAARAGAQVSDSEFVQFHPTALTGMGDPAPLATEALRGEGAVLLNAKGERFMTQVHENAELAPRDIVARAVFDQIIKTGAVGLDLRPNGLAANLDTRFPTVAANCQKAGIDPTQSLLPVAPATHFHMGGIRTDTHGRSSLPGLWACGEVAATGLHGANRLASNSLLEAIVFGARIAKDINNLVPTSSRARPAPPETRIDASDVELAPATLKLRTMMSRHVGVLRHADGLIHTLHELKRLQQAAGGMAPFANMVLAAQFITMAALRRQESRGGHFRTDFPTAKAQPEHSYLTMAELDAAYADLPEANPALAHVI
ncbi:MAG: L-aspartate oxidase [Rhodobiaceae bacterium]|nr:L-aspartate oxidase [Rhodobiaceae bacterium]